VLYFDLDVNIRSLLFVGLLSGAEYNLLSENYPLLSAILLSFILGYGFRDRTYKFYNIIINTVKALFLIPAGIFLGSLISILVLNTYLSWFVWGSLLNILFLISLLPFTTYSGFYAEYIQNQPVRDDLNVFQSETRYIINELSSL